MTAAEKLRALDREIEGVRPEWELPEEVGDLLAALPALADVVEAAEAVDHAAMSDYDAALIRAALSALNEALK